MNRPVQGIRVRKDGQRRREQLLDEAQRIIGERGYHGFGLQELAERCAMTRPGVLHHFGSKDGLLIELLRHRDARHERAVADLLGQDHDPSADRDVQRSRIITALRIITKHNIAQPELIRLQAILQTEAINRNHPAHAYFQSREAAKRQVIAGYLAAFTPHPESMARQIVALMDGLQQQWLREEMSFDLVTELDRALASIFRQENQNTSCRSDDGAWTKSPRPASWSG